MAPSLTILASLSLLITYLIYKLTTYLLLSRHHRLLALSLNCLPPKKFAHKDPIFGLDMFLENERLAKTGGLLKRYVERYEDTGAWTFSVLTLGERMITTCEPENVKAILAGQFGDFGLPDGRKSALIPIFGHEIFVSDGLEWEKSRALLRPNFIRSQINDLPLFESHIQKFLAKIPKDGSTIDIQSLFFELTLDTSTEFLFGESIGILDGTGGERFDESLKRMTVKAELGVVMGWMGMVLPDPGLWECKRYVDGEVGRYVRKAVELARSHKKEEKVENRDEEGEKTKYVFLERMAEAVQDEDRIRGELMNILVAGRDTTASLLSWLFALLARDDRVFKKLREEILTIGGKRPGFEEMKDLRYLQWCLNEALRLYPVVALNARMASKDTTLPVGGGPDGKSPVFMKKGTQVRYQAYVMHRREDLFGKAANEFKPERWETIRPGWQYLPFNGGPRICIGQQFALTEASYTTVRLLQSFKAMERRDELEMMEVPGLAISKRGGVLVGLTPA